MQVRGQQPLRRALAISVEVRGRQRSRRIAGLTLAEHSGDWAQPFAGAGNFAAAALEPWFHIIKVAQLSRDALRPLRIQTLGLRWCAVEEHVVGPVAGTDLHDSYAGCLDRA